jgi:hypothetical protein
MHELPSRLRISDSPPATGWLCRMHADATPPPPAQAAMHGTTGEAKKKVEEG